LSAYARPLPHDREILGAPFLIGARLVTCGARFVRGRWAVTPGGDKMSR
jgi:hypothetical protein